VPSRTLFTIRILSVCCDVILRGDSCRIRGHCLLRPTLPSIIGISTALALMSENVSWPKASEGGRVVGKEEIRSYWTRQ
jgi:hypothetical protein